MICGDEGGDVREGAFVGLDAVDVSACGRIGFVDGEPLLGLFFAFIMKAVIHPAGAEGFEIGGTRSVGKTGGMNRDADRSLHFRIICR